MNPQSFANQLSRLRALAGVLAVLALLGGCLLPTKRTPTPSLPVSGVTVTPSPRSVSIPKAGGDSAGASQGGDQGEVLVESPGMDPSSQQPAARLSIRLSEGQAQPVLAAAGLPPAAGEPLPPEQVDQLLARLPALPTVAAEQSPFRLAQQPIPPPRSGETIQQTFPQPESLPTPEQGEAGPLKVLRYSPEGEIPLAPFLSVTFNQPMVALGTLADLAAQDVPVRIEPPLPGTWRWLGTKTLTFEYDAAAGEVAVDRLPKATDFHVTIPAGVQSAVGGVLAEAVEWTFSTPPPQAVWMYPTDSAQPLDPVFFVAFDQRIDPAAVLETIQVTAGGQRVALALASEAEIEKDSYVSQAVKGTAEGRWLAFRALEPLPADTGVTVTIGPGTPSAEGPRLTTQPQTFSFFTYAPLRIEDHGCSWNEQCPPLTPFYIRFNNPIDPNAYTEDMLRVEPAIPGVVVNIYGSTIEIRGATQGQTTYQVTVSSELQDIFEQKLGQETVLRFKVGKAESLLSGPGDVFVTLDPSAAKPIFSVYAINHSKLNLKIYTVQPTDWPAFKQYLRDWQQNNPTPQLPGRLVEDRAIPLELPADTLTQVDIDLSQHLDGQFGHFIVVVEPPKSLFENDQQKWRRLSQTIHTWVQITHIGLDAFSDNQQLIAWATGLQDGAPLPGVTILPETGGETFLTAADGLARLPIPSGSTYLTARRGADQALLPRSTYYWGDDAWNTWPARDTLQWYVFDDRQMYKPGEEIHLKGWLRRIGGGPHGGVDLVGAAISAVSYQVTDPQGSEIASGQAQVNALGGFDFVVQLPQAVNLGYSQVSLWAVGVTGDLDAPQFYHSFQIQEFRRPEFEVTARNETAGPYFASAGASPDAAGSLAVLAVEAKYYAGGPLPGADVTWQVTSADSSYSPPNWPDFTFGTWQPWWWFDYGWRSGGGGYGTTETFSGQTDASGVHYLRLDFDTPNYTGGKPVSIVASATVMDVNRQAWSSSTSLLVHPASLYVGLRSERYFVERGTPLKIELIVTDIDGAPVADRPVEVRAARMEWMSRSGSWREEEADVQTCQVGSALQPVACTFETPVGGSYRITAVVVDDLGRQNQSQFTRWVSGGQVQPSRRVEQETLTLIPDKETYQPGDVAQILVQSPFAPAEGLLTVNRSGILSTQRFRLETASTTLSLPIQEENIPNLNLQVDVVGAAARLDDQGQPVDGAPPRPAYARGELTLNIPPLQRRLSVAILPDAPEVEPGAETGLTLSLTDASGQPAADAEFAVVIVDEAILALTNYQLSDPLSIFYANRPSYLDSRYSRASLILLDPLQLADAERQVAQSVQVEKALEAPAAADAMAPAATATVGMAAAPEEKSKDESANQPIQVRSDFNPLAVFAPSVRSDAAGRAYLPVKLPDNLTRYRVMVIAVDSQGRQFGLGESTITARLPLMVRPSPPRFLNFGDRFELPIVLQNQTDQDMTVDVAVRATNLTLDAAALQSDVTGMAFSPASAGQRVIVPAHDRVEVRFPAAAQLAGVARIQVAAVSGAFADAAAVELPVYTPATTEAFATYGVLDEGAVFQPLLAPSGVFPQYGGLQVSTSSTALQALTDAVLYLVAYPYECSEQLSSRILAVAALRDVLSAFDAAGLPSPSEMESAVARDLARLQGMQNDDGGFPYWRRGFSSIPFNTIHVAHALLRAQQKGFAVPEEMLGRALGYLQSIESYYPAWYGQTTRWTLSAYALSVRNLAGDRDAAKAAQLLQDAGLENLPLEAVGWLWPVLDDPAQLEAVRRWVGSRVVETPAAANFTTYYDDQTYLLLSSDRRTDAILLDALIADAARQGVESDLIVKVVNGLLAHRVKGRWGSTQENVFVLLALDRYFTTYEAQSPDFVARAWLGEQYAGEFEFRQRSAERQEVNIPMQEVLSATQATGGSQVILSKEGAGRMYYRLGLSYAPEDLNLPPVNMGFVVQRRYEGLDNPADVYQDAEGVWHIKAGSRVRVVVSMVADNRRYHVALVDPLPAGLEIVNPALAVSQDSALSAPARPYYGWWWSWFEHQNLRDERAEAFTSYLWEGVYEYSYIARATTPGIFVVPPAKAEEMYSPEVFGRSASDWVIVE